MDLVDQTIHFVRLDLEDQLVQLVLMVLTIQQNLYHLLAQLVLLVQRIQQVQEDLQVLHFLLAPEGQLVLVDQ